MSMSGTRATWIVAAFLLAVAAAAGLASFYVEVRWFGSLGFGTVFQTMIKARFFVFLAAFLVTYCLLRIVVYFASITPERETNAATQRLFGTDLQGLRRRIDLASILAALAAGFLAQTAWLECLQFLHTQPSTRTDPLFGRDVAFYLFRLPLLIRIAEGLLIILGLGLIAAGLCLLVAGHLTYDRKFRFSRRAQHLAAALGIPILLAGAARVWLSRYELVWHRNPLTSGAGYTDVYVTLPLLTATSLLLAGAALLLPWWRRRTPRLIAGVAMVLGAVGWAGQPVVTSLVQTLTVAPNEPARERPFLEWHIQATLEGYGLTEVKRREFPVSGDSASLDVSPETLYSIRLWDERPLKSVYNQIQAIRLYYEFPDVDVDRYVVDGNYRQVLLSARELNVDRLSPDARNWINLHFQYTHGYGLCMSPAAEVTDEGLPRFFIRDVPPHSTGGLVVERPEIYFGELTVNPVFVRTKLEEFDYPKGATNATTLYQADRGLPVSGWLDRLALAWVLADYRILFTSYFSDDSRVLLHRQIVRRVQRLAPFLLLDADPYPALVDGRVVWILDAYTTSRRYPYSAPFPSPEEARLNYIRNSVKITIDAYTGDVRFYVMDVEDPVVSTLTAVFPELFRSAEAMPPAVRDHLRYPQDLFEIQRRMITRYHMTDPTVFYNQEDAWSLPEEIYADSQEVMAAYYLMLSILGRETPEFVLLTPFTPRNKNNMIAWLAARCDPPYYGDLILYQFPKQRLTYGPMQVEARIDQNPEISQLFTLWSQKGSKVIRGNLLVIPTTTTVLYVEPVYLQAETSEIPELALVVTVHGDRVGSGSTLEEALADLRSEPSANMETAHPADGTGGRQPSLWGRWVQEALDAFEEGREALQRGDWGTYGAAQSRLREALERLRKAVAEEETTGLQPLPGGEGP
ncbi:MAG TPA: UPF0182 family protein [Acidobacteriota bacterium]|nr:UPF0182 family protein [Acidobacteriota bacterium]